MIEIARKRADVLIFTGGLGPTKDDMTKETIVKHIGTTLVSDDEALHYIQQYFERSGRVMTDNNKKQALVFKGAKVLAESKRDGSWDGSGKGWRTLYSSAGSSA